MRDQQLRALRNGVLTALGLLQACGGQAERRATAGPNEGASALTPGAGSPVPTPSPVTSQVPHVRCDPMAASESNPSSCWENPRYAWDGARCVALRCGCAGSECNSLFSSALGCYGERGVCDPLAAERAACIARNPNPPDDMGLLTADAGQQSTEMLAQLASAECFSASGTSCDSASFISEAAAVCIAKVEGLENGLGAWDTGVFFHAEHGRVARSVSNTTRQSALDGSGGAGLTIDATTGFVLDSFGWSAIPGRPFLVDRAARTAEAVCRSDCAVAAGVYPDAMPTALRATLSAFWTQVGLLEHASVAAFARFALQLLGLGAPPDLLQACQQAMQDELRHTQIAFGLASAYAGAPLGPGPLKLDGALDTPGDDLLAYVAMTTLIEGCIGETTAALSAREAAGCTTDPYVQQALAVIAQDEQRHAELAWRFLDWALARRSSLALPLLAQAQRARDAAQLSAPSGGTESAAQTEGDAALLQYGILPLAHRRELEAQALEQVILPCLVALTNRRASARSDEGRGSAFSARA